MTIEEASHKLWETYISNRRPADTNVQAIGIGDNKIVIYLKDKRRSYESYPIIFEGYQVEIVEDAEMGLC